MRNGLKKTKRLCLTAPDAGTVVPLTEVPDPTFAEGMMGQGVALLPSSGHITAPMDGRVEVMFETGHAVSLVTAEGVEVLIHVGIDTVKLAGACFTPRCRVGDTVRAGALLIECDLAGIATAGYSCVTPIVVCNSGPYQTVTVRAQDSVQAGDLLLELTP